LTTARLFVSSIPKCLEHNMNYTPKVGDIVRSGTNVYRMYYKDDWSKNLRCMNLGKADSYSDTEHSSESLDEEFVCNIKDIVYDATR
jgi:hypothetical protein